SSISHRYFSEKTEGARRPPLSSKLRSEQTSVPFCGLQARARDDQGRPGPAAERVHHPGRHGVTARAIVIQREIELALGLGPRLGEIAVDIQVHADRQAA